VKYRSVFSFEKAKAFDKDRSYTEREVNIIIADFNDDFCTIRKKYGGRGPLYQGQGQLYPGVVSIHRSGFPLPIPGPAPLRSTREQY
jgi:hypothetical protein